MKRLIILFIVMAGLFSQVVNVANDVTTISFEHQSVHRGRLVFAGHYFPAVADDALAVIHIKTGANTLHFFDSIVAGGVSSYSFYEGIVATNNGTQLTAYNFRRELTNVLNGMAYISPLVTNYGTRLFTKLIPAGTKQAGVGADFTSPAEFNLKTNTSYLMVVSNFSGAAVDISMFIYGYREY